MIPELGHFALILAFCAALVQGSAPLWGAWRGHAGLMALAPGAALAQAVLILIAFAALTWAHVVSDFSVQNVFENSHSLKPMLYKVSGVWGNHEGSLLLWVLILALFGLAVAFLGGNLPVTLRSRVLAVQGLIAVGFLAFSLFTSNPFLRLDPAPLDGQDLNPLLQDPGLAFHPPFLYLGYVGFSMTFSFAVAALLEGRVDAAWARWVRPWTLAAWVSLTLGIAMGSWWAYYELGWGGWWFWDPVENASFMPWLAGTALLHSAIVTEKRGALKSWTVLLAIIAFSLSLLGTFLVRSGVLTSVHAFATDPTRGVFILLLLIVAIGGSLALYAWRAPTLKADGLFAPISREGALVLNNLLLATACFTVLVGTLYPLFLDVIGGGKISVGPPYFELTFIPLMVPLLLALAVGPLMPWKRADLRGVLSRMKAVCAFALVVWGLAWWFSTGASPLPAFGIALATWIAVAVGLEYAERIQLFRMPLGQSWRRARGLPRAAYGMSVAHLGMAVLVAGVTASSSWQSEVIRAMAPGESQDIAGYTITFEGTRQVNGPNYSAERGQFRIFRGGEEIAVMEPEKRQFFVQTMQTTEAAIRTNLLGDLYVVLGDRAESGAWAVRLYYNPLVPWIWGGCLLMVFGGLISLSDRRLRLAIPKRRPAPSQAQPQPA
ncbi:MAG: heme lyase CcmF/NrfE family subunit [Rhodospirillaceae bacterium]|nr:heme lyase CcmF/NrfE family subunit [Rhodospirillaceae bacterium]